MACTQRSGCSCRFGLGDKAPQLTGIKVYETDRASDTIIIEADGSWASHQDVQLTVRALHFRNPSSGLAF